MRRKALSLVAWGPIEKPAASRAGIGFQVFLKILGTSQGTTVQSLFFCSKVDSNHRQIRQGLSLPRTFFNFCQTQHASLWFV